MSRIFGSLALVAVLMLVVTMGLGFPLNTNVRVQRLRDLNNQIARLKQEPSGAAEHSQQLAQAQEDFTRFQGELYADRRSSIHMLLGVASALVVILVQSISVTYFIGTSRWCREVVDTYQLDSALIARSQTLKRSAFPWAMLGILSILATVVLGAASDPGTFSSETSRWVTPHFIAALIAVACVTWSFLVIWLKLSDNQQLIAQIMADVRDKRAARGLAVQ